MAIKVHGSIRSSATKRVFVCLHEKQLDFELIPVDLASGAHKKEPFLSLNPFGQAPALVDGDLTLFESRAINQYITQAYFDHGNPLISKDPKKMANISVWSDVESQKFEPPASKLTWELCFKPIFLGVAADDAVVEEQEGALAKVLDVYEARLAKSNYLGGDGFTLVDLHHLPTISTLMGTRTKTLFLSRPHVKAWSENIMARPAWQKVLAMKM